MCGGGGSGWHRGWAGGRDGWRVRAAKRAFGLDVPHAPMPEPPGAAAAPPPAQEWVKVATHLRAGGGDHAAARPPSRPPPPAWGTSRPSGRRGRAARRGRTCPAGGGERWLTPSRVDRRPTAPHPPPPLVGGPRPPPNQSPSPAADSPCSMKASPVAHLARRSCNVRHSPANTSGGIRAISAVASRSVPASGYSGCWCAVLARHDDGAQAARWEASLEKGVRWAAGGPPPHATTTTTKNNTQKKKKHRKK